MAALHVWISPSDWCKCDTQTKYEKFQNYSSYRSNRSNRHGQIDFKPENPVHG